MVHGAQALGLLRADEAGGVRRRSAGWTSGSGWGSSTTMTWPSGRGGRGSRWPWLTTCSSTTSAAGRSPAMASTPRRCWRRTPGGSPPSGGRMRRRRRVTMRRPGGLAELADPIRENLVRRSTQMNTDVKNPIPIPNSRFPIPNARYPRILKPRVLPSPGPRLQSPARPIPLLICVHLRASADQELRRISFGGRPGSA